MNFNMDQVILITYNTNMHTQYPQSLHRVSPERCRTWILHTAEWVGWEGPGLKHSRSWGLWRKSWRVYSGFDRQLVGQTWVTLRRQVSDASPRQQVTPCMCAPDQADRQTHNNSEERRDLIICLLVYPKIKMCLGGACQSCNDIGQRGLDWARQISDPEVLQCYNISGRTAPVSTKCEGGNVQSNVKSFCLKMGRRCNRFGRQYSFGTQMNGQPNPVRCGSLRLFPTVTINLFHVTCVYTSPPPATWFREIHLKQKKMSRSPRFKSLEAGRIKYVFGTWSSKEPWTAAPGCICVYRSGKTCLSLTRRRNFQKSQYTRVQQRNQD